MTVYTLLADRFQQNSRLMSTIGEFIYQSLLLRTNVHKDVEVESELCSLGHLQTSMRHFQQVYVPPCTLAITLCKASHCCPMSANES